MSFRIRTSGTFPFEMPFDFEQKNRLYDQEGIERGTALLTSMRHRLNRL